MAQERWKERKKKTNKWKGDLNTSSLFSHRILSVTCPSQLLFIPPLKT